MATGNSLYAKIVIFNQFNHFARIWRSLNAWTSLTVKLVIVNRGRKRHTLSVFKLLIKSSIYQKLGRGVEESTILTQFPVEFPFVKDFLA